MQRFEYNEIMVKIKDAIEVLDYYGSSGWEVVQFYVHVDQYNQPTGYRTYLLKKESN